MQTLAVVTAVGAYLRWSQYESHDIFMALGHDAMNHGA